jgi:hypothetical protein
MCKTREENRMKIEPQITALSNAFMNLFEEIYGDSSNDHYCDEFKFATIEQFSIIGYNIVTLIETLRKAESISPSFFNSFHQLHQKRLSPILESKELRTLIQQNPYTKDY